MFMQPGKMKKSVSFFCLAITASTCLPAQNAQQSWDSIKNAAMPVVDPTFQNEYDAPYRQPLADYGWEDGLQISPDGLNLYALYSPMDLLSRTSFVVSNPGLPFCEGLANMSFIRPYANSYGMDLTTNPFGCDSFFNIDILYAHRNTQNESFTNWQLSGIARPALIEGGPAPLFSESDPNLVDLFIFSGNGDLSMIKNTSANPSGIENAIRLPTPINPDSNEFIADNAFLERLNGDTIIMIYEKYTDPAERVFMYVLSTDTGNTWNTPQAILTINNSLGHIEHPCLYKDNDEQWWLYYSLDFTHIVRSRQTIAYNWDSWDTPEIIISKGNGLSIGEPTVARNGDISFSLAYVNTILNDPKDRYDLDPWLLPHKTISAVKNYSNHKQRLQLNVFPNPATEVINIAFDLLEPSRVSVEIVDMKGQKRQQFSEIEHHTGRNIRTFNVENLPDGAYYCIVKTDRYTGQQFFLKHRF